MSIYWDNAATVRFRTICNFTISWHQLRRRPTLREWLCVCGYQRVAFVTEGTWITECTRQRDCSPHDPGMTQVFVNSNEQLHCRNTACLVCSTEDQLRLSPHYSMNVLVYYSRKMIIIPTDCVHNHTQQLTGTNNISVHFHWKTSCTLLLMLVMKDLMSSWVGQLFWQGASAVLEAPSRLLQSSSLTQCRVLDVIKIVLLSWAWL